MARHRTHAGTPAGKLTTRPTRGTPHRRRAPLLAALALTLLAALAFAAPEPAATQSSTAQASLALLAVQQAELTTSDGAGLDHFGFSVAILGDTALVGAPGASSGWGAAYIFVRSGSSWTQQAS